MFVARVIAAASMLALCVPTAHAQSQGPSYSCSSAELEAEITVCESRRLSRLDRQVDRLYQDARAAARTNRARRRLRREQKDWLSERNACEASRRCLRDLYESRAAALGGVDGGDSDVVDGSSQQPSFSCRNVRNRTERVICRSERLAGLDRELAASYENVRSSISGWIARRRLVRSQKRWIALRDNCEDDRRCIRDAYRDRTAVLEDYKRKIRPAYQRAAGWRANCVRPRHEAMATACRSERLWGLYLDLSTTYQTTLKTTRSRRVRRRIEADQAQWFEAWRECGKRDRCQRRTLEQRIVQLRDRDYWRDQDRKRRPTYQRDDAWRTACRGDVSVALRTTCNSERLWSQYVDMSRTYQAALRSGNRPRRRIERDQNRWNEDWVACRRNERCQSRKYSERIAELNGIVDRRGSERPVRRSAYQRTEAWQQTCPGIPHAAGQTTCNSERLWALNVQLRRAYNRTLQWADGYGARQYIADDQRAWSRSWQTCGANERCQRRAYRDRIAELDDRAYRLRQQKRGQSRRAKDRPRDDDYRRSARWQSTCRTVSHAAGRTTCSNAELWRLNVIAVDAYNDALAAAGAGVGAAGLVLNNRNWNASWRSCGGNVQCQRRSYKQRIRDLRDPDYMARFFGNGVDRRIKRKRKINERGG